MSRRRALGLGAGLGAGAAIALVAGPFRLVGTGSAASPSDATTAEIANPVVNPSFEDGPPGPTAPGWTFR